MFSVKELVTGEEYGYTYSLTQKSSRIYANCVQIKKSYNFRHCNSLIFSLLGGTRTHGPLIKSQLLYQLSYEEQSVFAGAKIEIIMVSGKNSLFK